MGKQQLVAEDLPEDGVLLLCMCYIVAAGPMLMQSCSSIGGSLQLCKVPARDATFWESKAYHDPMCKH